MDVSSLFSICTCPYFLLFFFLFFFFFYLMNVDYTIKDLICKSSPILFADVNPSTSNTGSDVGHYFAGPKNQFFRLVHASGKEHACAKGY